jgi:hypothetical protein
VDVYEFVGQTGAVIANPDTIESSLFAQYVFDDNLYEPSSPNDELTTPITNPTVYTTGKCLQVSSGKRCGDQDQACCPGVVNCDIVYSLEDSFGRIGDITVAGNIQDGFDRVNVLTITGGTGALLKAYGEVAIANVYNNTQYDDCPFINEIALYNVAAKIYVEVCEYEHQFYAERETEPVKKKRNQNNYGW